VTAIAENHDAHAVGGAWYAGWHTCDEHNLLADSGTANVEQD
jgi:hypothetical protein